MSTPPLFVTDIKNKSIGPMMSAIIIAQVRIALVWKLTLYGLGLVGKLIALN
jgi:hypothetical protein